MRRFVGIGAALLVLGGMWVPAGRAVSPPAWPVFHQNNQRTSLSTASVSDTKPKLVWRVKGNTLTPTVGAFHSPVVGDGVVYANADPHGGGERGGVVALDAATGTVNWELAGGDSVGHGPKGAPAIGPDGTIYVAFRDNLVALADNGTSVSVLWTFPPVPEWGNFSDGPTVGPDGTIYIPTVNGFLAAIAPQVTCAPTLTRRPVSCPSTVGVLTVIPPSAKWEFQTAPDSATAGCDADLRSLPAIGTDGTIYVGSDEPSGRFWHLRDDGTDATVLDSLVIDAGAVWRKFCKGAVARHDLNSTPAIDEGNGHVYVGSDDGNLYALDSSDVSTIVWSGLVGQQSGNCCDKGPEDSAPAVAGDGTVVVGSADGRVHAFNANGTPKWTTIRPCGGGLGVPAVESSPAISSNGLVIIGTRCGLRAYALSNGAQKWRFWSGDIEFSPAIGSDGTVFFSNDQAHSQTGEASALLAVKGT